MRLTSAAVPASGKAFSLAFLGGQTVGQPFGGVFAQEGDRTDAVRQAVVGGAARNVILFLGDGMGDSPFSIAAGVRRLLVVRRQVTSGELLQPLDILADDVHVSQGMCHRSLNSRKHRIRDDGHSVMDPESVTSRLYETCLTQVSQVS